MKRPFYYKSKHAGSANEKIPTAKDRERLARNEFSAETRARPVNIYLYNANVV